ncbi:dethiobiotin synthase [Victivallis vadensis]|uniref:dethiobiotin synthase n=1 Tax=Victivallis vadensis TaxID=172901 RepID=UPI003AF498A9
MNVYFVSGIDTDIGKTVAVGMMARYLHRRGRRVITVKLIQTGNVGFSEDLDRHRAMMGVGRFPEDEAGLTAPAIFSFPASPHFAAAREHRTVDLDAIRAAVEKVSANYDVVLLEGAGGLAVPLTEDLLTVDFAAERRYPLILVTSGHLGSLNHTIMSIEMAVRRGMKLAGVVYNWSAGADPEISADSRRMILKYLNKYQQPEILVELGKVAEPYPDTDFGPIFGER